MLKSIIHLSVINFMEGKRYFKGIIDKKVTKTTRTITYFF